MARFSANVSAGGRSQRSCCFWPITSVIDFEERDLAAARREAGHANLAGGRVEQTRTSILSVVVLPAPFGPRKPTRSPAAMSKEMPSTARTSLYSRWKSERTRRHEPGRALVDAVDLGEPVDLDHGSAL